MPDKISPNANIDRLVAQICALPQDWHGAGTVNAEAVRAIARHVLSIGPIDHTVETGSGRSTLLLSHLSPDHRVFALDAHDSISAVRASSLLNPGTVTFVEGPTQLTMPGYDFPASIQVALIDGPHGYPFPDLEYYRLYPRIAEGGLLLVDDILIPSIRRMFDIIRADRMFELLEVVGRNLAIFRRTAAPVFDPLGDGWWLQGYNGAHYRQLMTVSLRTRLIDALSAAVPGALKDRLPGAVKSWIWSKRS